MKKKIKKEILKKWQNFSQKNKKNIKNIRKNNNKKLEEKFLRNLQLKKKTKRKIKTKKKWNWKKKDWKEKK